MPYLVKVGYERYNKYRLTSKGYFIKRTGTKVFTQWAAIDAIGLKRKKFYWHKSVYSKTYNLRTIQRALQFKQEKISYLIGVGYDKLPPGTKIYMHKIK